jgi:hypothetical protein
MWSVRMIFFNHDSLVRRIYFDADYGGLGSSCFTALRTAFEKRPHPTVERERCCCRAQCRTHSSRSAGKPAEQLTDCTCQDFIINRARRCPSISPTASDQNKPRLVRLRPGDEQQRRYPPPPQSSIEHEASFVKAAMCCYRCTKLGGRGFRRSISGDCIANIRLININEPFINMNEQHTAKRTAEECGSIRI